MDINNLGSSTEEYAEIQELLQKLNNTSLTVTDIWKILDEVWDEIGCNNQESDWGRIHDFYSHPV